MDNIMSHTKADSDCGSNIGRVEDISTEAEDKQPGESHVISPDVMHSETETEVGTERVGQVEPTSDEKVAPDVQLMSAFQTGLKHTLSLVEHMSPQQRSKAVQSMEALLRMADISDVSMSDISDVSPKTSTPSRPTTRSQTGTPVGRKKYRNDFIEIKPEVEGPRKRGRPRKSGVAGEKELSTILVEPMVNDPEPCRRSGRYSSGNVTTPEMTSYNTEDDPDKDLIKDESEIGFASTQSGTAAGIGTKEQDYDEDAFDMNDVINKLMTSSVPEDLPNRMFIALKTSVLEGNTGDTDVEKTESEANVAALPSEGEIIRPTTCSTVENDSKSTDDESDELAIRKSRRRRSRAHYASSHNASGLDQQLSWIGVDTFIQEISDGWMCTQCQKMFKTKGNLVVHARTHTGLKPYKCLECDKCFSVPSNMNRHVDQVHRCKKPYRCPQCDKEYFTNRAREKHIQKAHSTVVKPEKAAFICDQCGKTFKFQTMLLAHGVVHSEARPHACKYCNRGFSFKTNLLRHLKIHTGERPHKCDVCDKGFIEKKSLLLHRAKEHDSITEVTMVECKTCLKKFTSKANLYNHQFVHTGQKPYVCSICGKAFSMKSNMKRHERTHSGQRPWECPDCLQCFTEKKSMQVHRRQHTGERPYKCTMCDKRFAQPGALQSHMPVHIRQRKFWCNICGKTFLRKSHFNFHMHKHSAQPQLQCNYCEMKFYRKGDMERHKLTHTQQKPFICHICPKGFTRLQYLREHINQHMGLKPHKCKMCELAFADLSSFYKHVKSHGNSSSQPQQALEASDIVQTVSIINQHEGVASATSNDALPIDEPLVMSKEDANLLGRGDVVELGKEDQLKENQLAAESMVSLAGMAPVMVGDSQPDPPPVVVEQAVLPGMTSQETLALTALGVSEATLVQDVGSGVQRGVCELSDSVVKLLASNKEIHLQTIDGLEGTQYLVILPQ